MKQLFYAIGFIIIIIIAQRVMAKIKDEPKREDDFENDEIEDDDDESDEKEVTL
jgi:hypothetical protein